MKKLSFIIVVSSLSVSAAYAQGDIVISKASAKIVNARNPLTYGPDFVGVAGLPDLTKLVEKDWLRQTQGKTRVHVRSEAGEGEAPFGIIVDCKTGIDGQNESVHSVTLHRGWVPYLNEAIEPAFVDAKPEEAYRLVFADNNKLFGKDDTAQKQCLRLQAWVRTLPGKPEKDACTVSIDYVVNAAADTKDVSGIGTGKTYTITDFPGRGEIKGFTMNCR